MEWMFPCSPDQTPRGWFATAVPLVVVGEPSRLFGIIIGGRAAPRVILPGKEIIEGALVAAGGIASDARCA